MRLYRILGAAWAGTQADAKAAAKDANTPWHEYEVPTDKTGLLAFLNERNVPAQADEVAQLEEKRVPMPRDPMDAPAAEPINMASVAAKVVRQSQESFTAGEIEDFILNRATVAQVENIFAALGTRFAEKRAAA